MIKYALVKGDFGFPKSVNAVKAQICHHAHEKLTMQLIAWS